MSTNFAKTLVWKHGNMTSNCDITNSAHQIQITTIWPWTKTSPHENFLRTPLMTNWPFIRIASCHETECSTGGTIAPAVLLLPESWRWNRQYLNWYQNMWSIDIGQGSFTYMASRANVNPTHKTISFGLVRHFVNYICNYDISTKNLLI